MPLSLSSWDEASHRPALISRQESDSETEERPRVQRERSGALLKVWVTEKTPYL